MKTKRWMGILLGLVLLLALAGCGANSQVQNEKKNESEALSQTQTAETLSEALDEDGPVLTPETGAADPEEKNTGDSKTLVIYFSYTGHLDSMAHWIADESGADLVRVTAKEAYPEDYDETVDRAKKEQNEDARPEIDIDLTDEQMAEYDTVFFGFPVWWYDIPMPMYTFLDTYDLSGKTIIPFLSHEGSSNGANARKTMEGHAADATVRFDDALSIRGGEVDSSEQAVRDWVDGLGFGK